MKARETLESAVNVAGKMLLGGNLASLSLIGTPRRMLEYVSECLFLYGTHTSRRGLRQRNVFEVLPSRDVGSIILGNLKRGTWFSTSPLYAVDLVSLCLICQLIQPKLVFEIGTLRGYLALHFALNTPSDSKIYTLDLPRDGVVQPRLGVSLVDRELIDSYLYWEERYYFESTDVASKINLLFGDSASFDYSAFHGQVDFFFVDGAHSYEYVRSDTLNALKCCHPGSVIAWHDFGKAGVQGVSRWVVELSKRYEIYSVPGGSVAFMVVP